MNTTSLSHNAASAQAPRQSMANKTPVEDRSLSPDFWSENFRLLAIESTCDETAAAVIDGKGNVLSSVVATQEALHHHYGGVVPEIAARAHLERMPAVIDAAMKKAACGWNDLGGVAVANTPGLAGSLLVGLCTAKALALALDVPLVAVNHLHAHVYAGQLAAGENIFPCLALIASGGHTSLHACQDPLQFELLGSTTDDAAGEAFDKGATLLGLPYPGGPALEKAASAGNPKAFAFPRPLLNDASRLDFSFSGLKTALRYAICSRQDEAWSNAQLTPSRVADLAASYQAAVVDCLVGKTALALQRRHFKRLCVAGGVACNRALRTALEGLAKKHGVSLIIPPVELCTDNAAMGAIALEHLRKGQFSGLDLEILPGLIR